MCSTQWEKAVRLGRSSFKPTRYQHHTADERPYVSLTNEHREFIVQGAMSNVQLHFYQK